MEELLMIIPVGVVLTLVAFLFFEKRSIATKKLKEAQGLPPPEVGDFYEKFARYDTLNNTIRFFGASYVISLALAVIHHDPSYGLPHALIYIFVTTFIGSVIIFFLKFKKSILVKVFAAFLYGTPHMAAAAAAFVTRFIFS